MKNKLIIKQLQQDTQTRCLYCQKLATSKLTAKIGADKHKMFLCDNCLKAKVNSLADLFVFF